MDKNAKSHFGNKRGGTRYAVGVGGSVTGMHGHILIIDDPLDPKQAASDLLLKAANDWMTQTLPSRKVNKETSLMILVMQRLHENDPTGNRLLNKGAGPIRHICLPAEIIESENVEIKIKPDKWRSRYKWGLLDPIRMPKKVLNATEAELGAFGYAGQYLQNPVPPAGGLFHAGNLKTVESYPHGNTQFRFVKTVRYWDKASTAGGGTYTVGVKMALDNSGYFWVLDVVRGQWNVAQRERIIRATALSDGAACEIRIEQEPGSGGKESAQATVRMLAGFSVTVDRPEGNKELRADPYAVQVTSGNVYMIRAAWNRDYVHELSHFPMGKYKDQVDASSGAFAALTKVRKRIGAF